VTTVIKNTFEEAADYARIYQPFEMNLLIVPIHRLPEIYDEIMILPKFPVLYVTRTGYVPYATKSEIIRRERANLFLLGGEESISEWVEYVLSTFTKGGVYRLISANVTSVR
jgi:hypothetical protein